MATVSNLAPSESKNLTWVQKLISVPKAVGDDARRRRLLNIVLFAIFLLSALLVVVSILQISSQEFSETEFQEAQLLVISSFSMVVIVGILFLINRYVSGVVSATLLVLLLTAAISVSDNPTELTSGRSTFFFALPIMIASVALRPRSTFFAATLVVVALYFLTDDPLRNLNYSAITGFYVVALLSWLAASSLENALKELQVINAELDHRVEERTLELKVALENVQRESKKSEAILASIADGVVVFDAKGLASVANSAISKLLDLPRTEIIGTAIDKLTQNQIGLQTLNEKSELTNHKINLNERTLSISLASVQIEGGVSKEIVAVFRDFTQEEQLNRMKDAFVSMASHELRTPLNAIIGYSDMLKEGVYGESNEEQERLYNRIMANSKRMLSLVNNMLDQAQIAVGKLVLNNREFHLNELTEEVDSVISVLAQSKGLAFKISADEAMPKAIVNDKERLFQIIVNLTGNAVKFTEKGSINVRFKRADENSWELIVQDTGRGIPKHMLETIFEPFEQVDDTYTRNTGGTGLGLSIVRLLTDLMGGTIRVDSTLGVGSTFTIHLPLTVI